MGRNLNKKTKLTIGRLAGASGVGISTVRYYQKRGLLRQPERPSSGTFRSYSEQDLERLLLIRQAQEFGFTLAEIADLVAHVDANNCQAIQTIATRKLQGIRTQIKLLQNIRRALSGLIAACRHGACGQCLFSRGFHKHAPKDGPDA